MPSPGDLIQIVDAAMAEAVRKSGSWIACKPGCFECCIGPFPITMLDAERLRTGLAGLARTDGPRAARVRTRAAEYRSRIPEFPGVIGEGPGQAEAFDALDENEVCPALDPGTGTCDLYAARPLTCRVFGPAVRGEGGVLGICELCYQGATEEQIDECAVTVATGDLEFELLAGDTRQTIVACALV